MNVLSLKTAIENYELYSISDLFNKALITDGYIGKECKEIEYDSIDCQNRNFRIIITLINVRVKNEDDMEKVTIVIEADKVYFG